MMCKDHDIHYNPINPTTIFRPSDTKAECLTTVTINDTIEFRWFYRSNSSKDWISCYNWSERAIFAGEYYYEGHLLIAGYWPGSHYPRAYRVDVYLDGSPSFSDFFEVTNGGLNSPRTCENVEANGDPVNLKSRFTIGTDTEVYHYLRFDRIAYFNEQLGCCHNFTTAWIQPDGSTYKTYSDSFPDYKDTNITWNYWKYNTTCDYININSSTPVGSWKVEVYLDSYLSINVSTRYGPIATTPFTVESGTAADWTFMVYLDGDNSLEDAGIATFLKIASVGSSQQVNIVVQMDRNAGQDDTYSNWTDCKRFYVTKGMTPTPENATADLGEVDMGNPGTLNDFVNWTINNYPANYYCLVLWDHGAGCMGFCWDVTSASNYLSLPDLSQALSGLPVIVDAVLIDACSSGMAEVAYQIKDYANVLVGPEGLGYGPAPYDFYLSSLTSNPWMSPNTFASEIVKDYMIWCSSIPEIQNATMSATDLTKVTSLIEAADDFAIELKKKETPHHKEIGLARNLTEGYPGPIANQTGYYIDLYHFAQLGYQYVFDEELQNAANQLMISIGNATIKEAHKSDLDSHGLSIFYPDEKEKYESYESVYSKTSFAIDTSWDEFVKYDLSGCVLTIRTPYSGIPIKVDEESYTTDAHGKIQVFLLPAYHTVNATTSVIIGSDSRGVFVQWNDTNTLNPRPLLVSGALTLEAQYETQYRLIMDASFGSVNPSIGEHWYKAGTLVNIQASTQNPNSDEQYTWLGWTGVGISGYSGMTNSTSISMDGPINETAAWKHEYYLTVASPYGPPTPTSGWCEANKSFNVSVTSPVSGPAGTQYVSIGWNGTGSVFAFGTNTSVTFTMGKASNITWNWKVQYQLAVYTDPAGLSPQPDISPPGIWYDIGTQVTCTAQNISEKVFDHWTVNGTDLSRGINPMNVTMDRPYEIYAHYVRAPTWWENLFSFTGFQIILGFAGIALAVVLARTAWMRNIRRKEIMKAREVVLPNRVSSGYADLDSLLFGGIRQNYAVILTSPTCDERDLLIKKFLEAGAKEGQITFYVTINPGLARTLTEDFQSNFYLFVCNPQADAIVKSSPNVIKLKGVENLTDISIALTSTIGNLGSSPKDQRRVCIGLISDVLLQHHAVQTRRWLAGLIPELQSKRFTTLAVMDPEMHPPQEVRAVLDLFEGEINIYEKETEKGSEKFLKIKKMLDQKYSESELPLKKELLETRNRQQSKER
jgi:KaiC/GvpD/RAD55 family RecA-like ATPase